MESKRISVDGVELAYQETGQGERPFVLVHGYTGSKRDFRERLPELGAHGRTIALDLRGHGESTGTGDAESYTLAQLVDDLLGFLAALGIERCDLLGHSMGGMVAQRAVLAAPERFHSLVLMDTAARRPEGIPEEMFRTAWKIARASGMRALLDILRARGEQDPTRTEADRRLEASWGDAYWDDWRIPNFCSMDPEAYAALGASMLEQEPLATRLAEIDCPTLVLVGEGDRSFLAAADELERGIPGARRATIPEAGHSPQLETPEAWLAAVTGFLREVRGS